MNPAMLIPLQLILTALLQVLFFQNLVLWSGWGIPLFHLLGLLLLPLNTRPIVLMMVSMLVGVGVDLFAYGGGIFASSAVTMAVCLPFINRLLAPREGYEVTDEPTIKSLGIQWFSVRTFAALLIHNLWMFSFEAGRWDLLLVGWGKAASSSALGLFVFVVTLLLVQAKGKKR